MVILIAAEIFTTITWYTVKTLGTFVWASVNRIYYGPYISPEQKLALERKMLLDRVNELELSESDNRQRIEGLEALEQNKDNSPPEYVNENKQKISYY